MEESNNMELLRLLADESAAEAKKRDAEEDEKAATSKKRDAEEEENVATAKKRAAEGTLKKIKADIVKMEHKKKQDDVIKTISALRISARK